MGRIVTKTTAIISLIGSYLMLVMGAVVSKTGSGMGCGNTWPFCHGKLLPESLPIATIIEYSHRIVSGIVGFIILILTVLCYICYKEKRLKIYSSISLFFVILQGALGALTVVFRDIFAKKAALALHFGFALIVFSSIVLLCLVLFNKFNKSNEASVSKKTKYLIWLTTGYTYIVVYTGALVRHSKATMGCGYNFPFCGDAVLSLNYVAGIHMLHRMMAFILLILVIVIFYLIYTGYPSRKDLVWGAFLALLTITIQVVSGVLTVYTGGQLLASLVHTTVISIFFSIMCYISLSVRAKKRY